MKSEPERFTDQDLIDEFIKYAEIKGTATNNSVLKTAIRAAQRLSDLDIALSKRSPSVRLGFLPYLSDRNEGVRYYVSCQLLDVAPVPARIALERLAKGVGPISADARGTLMRLDVSEYGQKP